MLMDISFSKSQASNVITEDVNRLTIEHTEMRNVVKINLAQLVTVSVEMGEKFGQRTNIPAKQTIALNEPGKMRKRF